MTSFIYWGSVARRAFAESLPLVGLAVRGPVLNVLIYVVYVAIIWNVLGADTASA